MPRERAVAEALDGGAAAGVAREVDCLILNLGGMCMLYNHIQNTHSILYLFVLPYAPPLKHISHILSKDVHFRIYSTRC